jgi:hypothetical protein
VCLADYSDFVCPSVTVSSIEYPIDKAHTTPSNTQNDICSTCNYISFDNTSLPQFCTERCTTARYTCNTCTTATSTASENLPSHMSCEKCHKIRHRNNLSPSDIILGACGAECDRDLERTIDSSTLAHANDSASDASHFVLQAVVNGVLCRVLIDTGATANFVSSHLLQEHSDLDDMTSPVENTSVRLGNNTVQLCQKIEDHNVDR